jgi:hypothetical protein
MRHTTDAPSSPERQNFSLITELAFPNLVGIDTGSDMVGTAVPGIAHEVLEGGFSETEIYDFFRLDGKLDPLDD